MKLRASLLVGILAASVLGWFVAARAQAQGTQIDGVTILLALADGGYGGAAFKQLYDIEAAKDAQLPADASDPYRNRHQLAAQLVKLTGLGQ
jgi:hypothetical protein